MMKQFFTFILFSLLGVVLAADPAASTSFSTAGRVSFSQLGIGVISNDITGLATPDFSRQIENTDVGMTVELHAMGQRAAWKGKYIKVEKFLEPQGDNSFTVTWAFDIAPCQEPAFARLCIEIDPVSFDQLPPMKTVTPDAKGVFHLQGLLGDIEISTAGSEGKWFFEDFRRAAWSGRFRLRCDLPYNWQKGWKGKVMLNFKGEKTQYPAFRILPVEEYANQALTDETADDRQGGWTDQGRNDLSVLARGADIQSRGIPLSVGRKAIILAGTGRDYFPEKSAKIPVKFKAYRLDFLHAIAWSGNPGSVAFRYLVQYADGSQIEIPVITGDDVNNWHGQVEPIRGYLAWEGSNSVATLSLSHSRWVNPHPDKMIASIQVLGNPKGGAVPIVLGITALDAEKMTERQFKVLENLFSNKPRNDVDTSSWYPCPLPWGGEGKTILSGTALDASSLTGNHICGDYGRLIAVGDHLEFEKKPGIPVPVWGINFAANSAYPPKWLAPGIVDNLKRQGVNMVRFHKFAGMPGKQTDQRGFVKPELQDRMDYLIFLLKQAGIYVYLDWEDVLGGLPGMGSKWPFHKGCQHAAVFMPDIREQERAYAIELFGHKNPYTQTRLIDDPVLACIEIINEAALGNLLNINPRNALAPHYYAELDRQWKEWNSKRGKKEVKSFADDIDNPDRAKFTVDTQNDYHQSQRGFLRDKLGYRGLVTGNNIISHPSDLLSNSVGMDFSGLHGYVGHIPGYYNTPYDNSSVVRTSSPGIPFFGATWERPVGMPYCFGEWNFVYPNDFRCEGLPFTAAMMAFQGMPMSLFYCFTGPMNWGEWEYFLNRGNEAIWAHGQGTDPSTWGLTVPCAYAFRRGDIKPSNNTFTVRHTNDEISSMRNVYEMPQMRYSWMFMFGKVFTEITKKPDTQHWPMKRQDGVKEWDEIKSVAKSLGIKGVSEQCLVSDTGELRKYLDSSLFLVDTKLSKFAIGNLSAMGRDGKTLSGVGVSSRETFAALTLTSLDGKPIERSSRVLICLVGNSRNPHAVIQGKMIVDPGWEKGGVVITEPLEATLEFPRAGGNIKVFKLQSNTGKRLGELPVKDGKFTIPKSAKTIYFELIRE